MSLLISLFPVISIILIGAIARNIKMFDDYHVKGFEVFLFKIGLPCYLFGVTLTQDIAVIINTRFILAYLITFIATFTLAIFLHKSASTKQKLSLSLASSYSNTALYLTPILFFLFNNPIAGVIANLVQVMIIQVVMILIFTFLNHSNTSKMKILFKVICAPFIIMPFVGLALNYFHLQSYVKYPYEITNIIGKSATGIALFVFGLNCTAVKFHDGLQKIKVIKIVLTKNFIHSLVAFCVGYFLFRLDGYWLKSLIIAASAPTAFLVYIISNQYNTNDDAIKTGIILSSITSVFTIIFISFLL